MVAAHDMARSSSWETSGRSSVRWESQQSQSSMSWGEAVVQQQAAAMGSSRWWGAELSGSEWRGCAFVFCVCVSHPRQQVEKEQFFILHAVLKDSTVLPKTPQPARCVGVQGRNTLICLICPSKQTSPVYIKPGQVGDKTFYQYLWSTLRFH